VRQTLLQNYDIFEIERPDPIANIHYFKRKLIDSKKLINSSLSSSPIDTKKITDPTQFNDPEFQNWLSTHEPEIYALLQKAFNISEDTPHNRDLKLATLEKCMMMFNKRYTPVTPEDVSRENAPLKEASNFPAIAGMSITEIQELCAMKDFLE